MTEDHLSFGFEEKPLDQTTIQELDALVKQMFDKRAEVERLEKEASEMNGQVELLKARVMGILEATGRLNHETPGCGKIYTQTKYQVSFPKDQESADLFRGYLMENGMDSMLTMNHQTLNAFFKSKVEEIEQGGGTPDLRQILPGIGEPDKRVVLAMKRGK